MKFLGCAVTLLVGFFATSGFAAKNLKDYAGSYQCPQLMQVKPAIKQIDKVVITVTVEGQKARVSVKPLGNFSFVSGEIPNGLQPGDFEFRSAGPLQLLAFSQMGPKKYLNLTYDAPEMAFVATACTKS